jgi:TRAP-type mannitol/chloroaromatic compound transport system permease large subunit
MAVNLQTSFLTPPFGFSLFYLRGVAPSSVRTLEIYKGIIPFIMLQLLMLVVLWYAPGLATWLPKVLF